MPGVTACSRQQPFDVAILIENIVYAGAVTAALQALALFESHGWMPAADPAAAW